MAILWRSFRLFSHLCCTSSSRRSSSPRLLSTKQRNDILAQSWTTVASGYEESFVPRFAAWTNDALAALDEALKMNQPSSESTKSNNNNNNSGLVLCCGPGQELIPIAKILGPAANVLGVDLAPGMVELAKRRIDAAGDDDDDSDNDYDSRAQHRLDRKRSISVQVGDAQRPPPGPYGAIFSAFGLQQLPDPIQAVKEWIRVLEPDGIGVILYWPPSSPPPVPSAATGIPENDEIGDPFDIWDKLLNKKLGRNNNNSNKRSTEEDGGRPPWDSRICEECVMAGAQVLRDEYIAHEMSFANIGDLFDRMSRAGPWHALRLRRGDDFVDELGKELEAAYSASQKTATKTASALTHTFSARMIVIRRHTSNRKNE